MGNLKSTITMHYAGANFGTPSGAFILDREKVDHIIPNKATP